MKNKKIIFHNDEMRKIDMSVIVFLLLYNSLIYIFLCVFLFPFPYEHDYAEGVNAISSLLILKEEKPYIDFLYPLSPIFIYVESIILMFNKSFFILRIFSFLLHFFTAIIISLIINIFSKNGKLVFLGVLFYLSTLTSITWIFIAIPDHLEIFFEISSLYFFLKYLKSRKHFCLFLSSLLLFLAFFTKFFAIVAIIVSSIFLLKIKDKFIDKLLYFYLVLGFIPLLYIIINVLTYGNFFLHTFLIHLFKHRYIFSLYRLGYLYNNSIIISITFTLIVISLRTIIRDIKIKFLSIYFLLLFLFVIYGRLTEGAYEHYFLHVEPAIFILIFILISKLDNVMLRKTVLLLLLFQVIFSAEVLSHYLENMRCAYVFAHRMKEVLDKYNISSGTMVIVEVPSIAFHNDLIISNNFIEGFCYGLLYRKGYWSDKELIQNIVDNDIKMIIIGSRLNLFENFTKYVSQHYILKEYIYYCDFTGERQTLRVYCKP